MSKKKTQQVLHVDEDDDSENDSDYNPDEDDDMEQEDTSALNKSSLEEMPIGRKRKVDDIWNSLAEDDAKMYKSNKSGLMFRQQSDSLSSTAPIQAKKKTKSKNKNFHILSQIFGKTQALQMINASDADVAEITDQNDDKVSGKETANDEVRQAIQEAVRNVKKKQKVVETRKFAGQEIKVETTVVSNAFSSSSTSSKSKAPSTVSALDNVLETIKGPKSVSTVSKSSMDWDSYKDKEGLADDLAKASKDGYLTRQEFLDRCDYRNFETEREQRLKAMTATMPTGGGSAL